MSEFRGYSTNNDFFIKRINNYQKKINIKQAYSILCDYQVIGYHNPIKPIMMYNVKIYTRIYFFSVPIHICM